MNKFSDEQLDSLIEEATMDAYGEQEEMTGFETFIHDNVKFPFHAEIAGRQVEVADMTYAGRGDLKAICRTGKRKFQVDLLDLKFDTCKIKGGEWIEAYKKWLI